MRDIVVRTEPQMIDARKLRQALWRLQTEKEHTRSSKANYNEARRAGLNLGIKELKQLLGDC